MSLLHTIASFIVALGLLIVVHEFGHYLVARWCGVKVLRFSVGFGRALVARRLGPDQTEWVIAAIPLGGYVKMLDEREGEVAPADLPRAFNRQSVWRRFAIVVAGPVANFLFAIALYWGLFLYGVPEARPILAAPEAGTAAARRPARGRHDARDRRRAIATWQDLRWRVLQLALDRQQARIEVADDRGAIDWRTLDLPASRRTTWRAISSSARAAAVPARPAAGDRPGGRGGAAASAPDLPPATGSPS